MRTSESIDQIATALAAAQSEMEVAKKDNTNTFFAKGASKAKYADINNVWIACRPALSKNGLCVLQAPSVTLERMVRLTTRLIHTSGEWVETDLDLKPKEDTPQAIGSCITYARRYSLASLVGVIAEDEDDDGNSASLDAAALKKQTVADGNQKWKSSNPAKKETKEQPIMIFDAANDGHVKKLEVFLAEAKISKDCWEQIKEKLQGKQITGPNLRAIVNEVIKGKTNA